MLDIFHKLSEWYLRLLAVLNLTVLFLSLLYVMKLFRSNLIHYKYYKYVAIIDSRVLSKMLYNYETELYKYFLLGLTLLFELIITLVTGSGMLIASKMRNNNNNYNNNNDNWKRESNDTFFNCTKTEFKVHYLSYLIFTYPALMDAIILILLLIISDILSLSFLCTYLKTRYCGYSLDKRMVRKYVVWWCVQALLLFLCVIPYTQILLVVICPILLLINWTLLVAESRRLSRAIRSVLYEIKHFECDDVGYRASYASYRTYRIFVPFQLLAVLFLIISLLSLCCSYVIHYFVLNNCNRYRFVNFNVDLSHEALEVARHVSSILSSYIMHTLILLYQIFTMAPLVLLAVISLSRYLNKKINLLKYDRHLSQPLL